MHGNTSLIQVVSQNIKHTQFHTVTQTCTSIYIHMGARRSRVVTFEAIRLRGPGFKPQQRQKFEMRFLLHSHPSDGEGVSPMQGEAIRRRYIKPEYLSYTLELYQYIGNTCNQADNYRY